jgi:hypothetical protein
MLKNLHHGRFQCCDAMRPDLVIVYVVAGAFSAVLASLARPTERRSLAVAFLFHMHLFTVALFYLVRALGAFPSQTATKLTSSPSAGVFRGDHFAARLSLLATILLKLSVKMRMRLFLLCAAIIFFGCGLSLSQASERFGRWALEKPEDFIFALLFTRSTLSDENTARPRLAFISDQEKKDVSVVMLFDGMSAARLNEAVPVALRKIRGKSDQSDLLQRWESGPGYIFLESPDEQEVFATYLKDREAERVKSIHLYILNEFEADKQRTKHFVVDLPGFSHGVAAFTNRCERSQ